jgi:excinuclease UvrABC nuclease subunit
MLGAAETLEFEKAAQLRDQIAELKEAPELEESKAGSGSKKDKAKKYM